MTTPMIKAGIPPRSERRARHADQGVVGSSPDFIMPSTRSGSGRCGKARVLRLRNPRNLHNSSRQRRARQAETTRFASADRVFRSSPVEPVTTDFMHVAIVHSFASARDRPLVQLDRDNHVRLRTGRRAELYHVARAAEWNRSRSSPALGRAVMIMIGSPKMHGSSTPWVMNTTVFSASSTRSSPPEQELFWASRCGERVRPSALSPDASPSIRAAACRCRARADTTGDRSDRCGRDNGRPPL